MPFYLGIDAGGSQTTCAIGSSEVVLGRAKGEACKLSKVTEKDAEGILRALITDCCKTARILPSAIEHTCIGIAGISAAKVSQAMRDVLGNIVSGEIQVTG